MNDPPWALMGIDTSVLTGEDHVCAERDYRQALERIGEAMAEERERKFLENFFLQNTTAPYVFRIEEIGEPE